ncbi:MAG: A/G-specific adenine glycosylase [Chloroflexota bacterium]|nr:A/G-specific adenine glycosylase [Chloroflexota bacterium]
MLAWYRGAARELPWRRTRNAYHILVAEVMLQQTQVERVLPKYGQWLEAFPTLAALAAAPTAEVIRLWAPLGYNGRAVRLQRIARECLERFNRQLPGSFNELLQLKGIGRYTAGAIACFAYGEQVSFWDTNVRRALCRIFRGADATLTPAQMDALAAEALPAGSAYDWHQALMDIGATICRARNPRCDLCPAMPDCAAHPRILSQPPRVAERRALYRAEPFETTNRYFRGRVVDLLRRRSPRTRPELLSDLQRADLHWLDALLAGLERDGLTKLTGDLVELP